MDSYSYICSLLSQKGEEVAHYGEMESSQKAETTEENENVKDTEQLPWGKQYQPESKASFYFTIALTTFKKFSTEKHPEFSGQLHTFPSCNPMHRTVTRIFLPENC